jgi:hypothetical protein
MSVVLFHRDYRRFQGGHLKVFHYFEHVRRSPEHRALIRFTRESVWDEGNPWRDRREAVVDPDEAVSADVLFFAGMDWQWLEPQQRATPPLPVINLVQGFSAVRGKGARHEFLEHPAIRVCVSAQIQEALESAGSVAGPIFTVPIGLDLASLPDGRAPSERDLDCVVLAVKNVPLGRGIADDLAGEGQRVLLVDQPLARAELLAAMARARVTVHLPGSFEGAYLPALESMALGALVVCPDCVGNRSFCRDGDTCLVPARGRRQIVKAARAALRAPAGELEPMLAAARAEAASRSLEREGERFLEILDRVEDLWPAAVRA